MSEARQAEAWQSTPHITLVMHTARSFFLTASVKMPRRMRFCHFPAASDIGGGAGGATRGKAGEGQREGQGRGRGRDGGGERGGAGGEKGRGRGRGRARRGAMAS